MFARNFLLLIIFMAIIGRFVRLDYAPPHLSNDEIAAAYTAYSISRTSKDSTNHLLPILWQSHGGYGSPLAVYLLLPSIMIFGNNDFAVRFPSSFLGALTIVFIGLLVLQLTKNKKLALLTSFLLAISPWHFSASRWALESNYGLFFVVIGVYLFFLSLDKNKSWIILASFSSFALSIYSYYAEWLLTPLIVLFLIYFYRKPILNNRRNYYLGIILFVILLVPLFASIVVNFKSTRVNSEFISKDIGVKQLLDEHPNLTQKGQIILRAILDKYSSYNSLGYLFFYGAKILPKENPYQFGFFLTPFFFCFFVGLYKLRNYYKRDANFIYYLFLISPLAAAMTEGDINNWRSLLQLFPVALITASGTLYVWNFIRNNFLIKSASYLFLLVSFVYFFLIYFRHFPLQRAIGYQYGFKQIALYINQHYNDYQKIVVDRRFGDKNYYYIGVPSSYIPFYTYLDPVKVQNATYLVDGIAFDKYEFRDINWITEKIEKGCLYVVPYDITPNPESNLKLVYEIKLPNWQPAFRMYTY